MIRGPGKVVGNHNGKRAKAKDRERVEQVVQGRQTSQDRCGHYTTPVEWNGQNWIWHKSTGSRVWSVPALHEEAQKLQQEDSCEKWQCGASAQAKGWGKKQLRALSSMPLRTQLQSKWHMKP